MAGVQITERVRGQNLAVLVNRLNGIPFEEGLRRANEGNLIISSNARLNTALVDTYEWQSMQHAFACWSGTMTAYIEPGQKLGKQVEYIDPETNHRWVFPVPERFQEIADAILITAHPEYTLEIDGNNRVVHATIVDLVENFPPVDGWYGGDLKHGIPIVSQIVRPDNSERYLYRIERRVGPAARTPFCDGGLDVGLDYRPSGGLGIVVEAP